MNNMKTTLDEQVESRETAVAITRAFLQLTGASTEMTPVLFNGEPTGQWRVIICREKVNNQITARDLGYWNGFLAGRGRN